MTAKTFILTFGAGLALTTLTACSTDSPTAPTAATAGPQAAAVVSSTSSAGGSTRSAQTVGRTMAWVDGELYGSVVTPATFDPANGNFDELYGGCAFLDGVGLISDAAPGDRDYNGGRWHLNEIRDPALCGRYRDASSDVELDPADFTSTTTYFECPLTPQRGRGRR